MAVFDFNYLNPFGLNNLVVQTLSHNMPEWIPVADATFRGPAAFALLARERAEEELARTSGRCGIASGRRDIVRRL